MASKKKLVAVAVELAAVAAPVAPVAPVNTVVAPSATAPLTAEQLAAASVAPAKAPKKVPRDSFSLDQTVATLVACPRRKGTDAEKGWAHYAVGKTLAQCAADSIAAGGKGCAVLDVGYFRWDLAHGYITLNAKAVAPVAPAAEPAAPAPAAPKAKKAKKEVPAS
jgi:hypothetical protein